MDELPAEIKHRIISYLYIFCAARTSVLSKAWKAAWDSRPVLVLEDVNMGRSFAGFLERSLQTRLDSGIPAEALSLRMLRSCVPLTSDAICRFSVAANLKELRIEVVSFFQSDSSCRLGLPSSHTLTKLELFGIGLKQPASPWAFPRLRSIELKYMALDSALIRDLVSASPALELFSVEEAHPGGLTTLDLPRHDSLKKLYANLFSEATNINIALRSPSLESFFFRFSNMSGVGVTLEIGLEACEATLKELSISHVRCAAGWLQSLVSKLPNLEVLTLDRISGASMLKISSTRLTDLRLIACTDLGVDTEIHAPNLLRLEYEESGLPFCSLVPSSSLPKSLFIGFYLHQASGQETVWFDKLSELFTNINDMSNVVISIIYGEFLIVHEGLSDALFDVLVDLYNSALHIKVFITSGYKSWEDTMVTPYVDDIFITSTDYFNTLEEFFMNKLPEGEVDPDESPYNIGSKYLRSCTMEALNDWSEFEGDAELRHALLRAYNESSSLFTRFSLRWVGI